MILIHFYDNRNEKRVSMTKGMKILQDLIILLKKRLPQCALSFYFIKTISTRKIQVLQEKTNFSI